MKYRRLLALVELGLAEGSSNGIVPRLSAEHMGGFRSIFNKAVNDLESEISMEKSRAGGSCGPPRKRRRTSDETDSRSQSSGDLLAMPPTPQFSSMPNHAVQQHNAAGSSFMADSFDTRPPSLPENTNYAARDLLGQPKLTNLAFERTASWVQEPIPGSTHY